MVGGPGGHSPVQDDHRYECRLRSRSVASLS